LEVAVKPILFVLIFLVAVFAVTDCRQEPRPAMPTYEPRRHFLSEGSSIQGRKEFIALGCNSCHSVSGDRLQVREPVGHGPELGTKQIEESMDELANAILLPSHTISAKPGPWQEDPASTMTDYSRIMTVRQLMDIIAYIKSPRWAT
jgi:hypothetical protein